MRQSSPRMRSCRRPSSAPSPPSRSARARRCRRRSRPSLTCSEPTPAAERLSAARLPREAQARL
eukprot:5905741-Prymnesium_polylepis.1